MEFAKISENNGLNNKIAIIIGGASGIGASTAEIFAREGANIVIGDITSSEEVEDNIRKHGKKVISNYCDITKWEDLENLTSLTLKEFGKIDILVISAGICERSDFSDITLEKWQKHLDINLTGTFLAIRSVYQRMIEDKQGKIVCIGSVAGQIGGVISGADYVASKGGVHSLIKSIAKEAAPKGVYINGVAPGPVESEMTNNTDYTNVEFPLNRMGQPEDIAEAALFLASDASNFITGSMIDVNGGINLR